ncbi:MAG: hypothetical protein LH468_08280 [Nocardioides sp.]|nr:hypothetical protein [Nocardioides sp.]
MGLAALCLCVAAVSCSGTDTDVDAGPDPDPPAETPTASASAAAPVVTTASVGRVAGRVGTAKRQRVKTVATRIVDGYLDGAYAGTYPRTDFSAAFADFRAEARREAEQDLSLLTNADIGAQLTSASPTRRRLRIDVLAPRGRPSAATARFVLAFDTTGEVTRSMRVSGSLLLTRQRGAWKVFGYDVRPQVRS